MIQPPRSPQLMQCVVTLPKALWGAERLNLGYAGPIAKVVLGDFFSARDCYSAQDILTFCGAGDGYVVNLYDQSGFNKTLVTQNFGTGPKICAAGKILTLATGRRTPVMAFDHTKNHHFGINDMLGFSGNPAITTVTLTGTITTTGQCVWLIGDQSSAGRAWYDGRENTPAPRFGMNIVGANHWFTQAVLVATTPNYMVWRKPAGGGISQSTGRQNGADLVHLSQVEGTMNLSTGVTRICQNYSATFYTPCTLALLGHWNALLAGQELAALEQYLERMRVQ